jgi:hypothetical protein
MLPFFDFVAHLIWNKTLSVVFWYRTPFPSTNKTDFHDIIVESGVKQHKPTNHVL